MGGGVGAAIALAVFCGLVASGGNEQPDVNQRVQIYVDSGFSDLQAMVDNFRGVQRDGVVLVPPGVPPMLFSGGMKCAKWSGFPKEFVEGLVGVIQEGVVVYPVTCFEDAATRNYCFVNAEGRVFCVVPPPAGYDPRWVLLHYWPDFYTQPRSPSQIAMMEAWLDPSRVVAQYTLIGKQELHDLLTARAKKDKDGGMFLMNLGSGSGGPNISNLLFTAMYSPSNGWMALELSYPTNFTNHVEIFSLDGGTGLIEGWWTSRGTTDVSTSTNYIVWTDTTSSNVEARFYVAGNGDLNSDTDPDGDNLTWAQELYLYHTSPTNSDTDGDGLDDYYEVMTSVTDPNNGDTTNPVVVIASPTNNFKWVWLP